MDRDTPFRVMVSDIERILCAPLATFLHGCKRHAHSRRTGLKTLCLKNNGMGKTMEESIP